MIKVESRAKIYAGSVGKVLEIRPTTQSKQPISLNRISRPKLYLRNPKGEEHVIENLDDDGESYRVLLDGYIDQPGPYRAQLYIEMPEIPFKGLGSLIEFEIKQKFY